MIIGYDLRLGPSWAGPTAALPPFLRYGLAGRCSSPAFLRGVVPVRPFCPKGGLGFVKLRSFLRTTLQDKTVGLRSRLLARPVRGLLADPSPHALKGI